MDGSGGLMYVVRFRARYTHLHVSVAGRADLQEVNAGAFGTSREYILSVVKLMRVI